MRRIPIIAAVAVALALMASAASADTYFYKILYPSSGPGDAALGPGGAKRVVVNFSTASPGLRARPNEINALTNVVVNESTPSGCGTPTATIDNATQFTVEWSSVCPVSGHYVIVTVISNGVQTGVSGSWKDSGGSQVSPAIITSVGTPAPALSPFAGAALVLLVGSTGLFVMRRRASALA